MTPYENLAPRYEPAPGILQDSLRAHGVYDTVRVLWDKRMKCLEVQGYGKISKRWHYCFYWAHYMKDGSLVPRETPATCEPLLEWMARIDEARFGKSPEENRRCVAREMDASRRERLAAVRAKRREVSLTVGKDYALWVSGGKHAFGSGYIRSRKHYQGGSRELEQAMADVHALESA